MKRLFHEGLSNPEIARLVGSTAITVGVCLSRAGLKGGRPLGRPRIAWTEEKVAELRELVARYGAEPRANEKIAAIMGISKGCIIGARDRNGLTSPTSRPQRPKWADDKKAEVLALKERGLSHAQIGRELGVSKHTVTGQLVRSASVPAWKASLQGVNGHAARERTQAALAASVPAMPQVYAPPKTCQWPMWGKTKGRMLHDPRPGPEPEFCGKPPKVEADGRRRSYCDEHCRHAYVPIKLKRVA
jgi:hypothetical protein